MRIWALMAIALASPARADEFKIASDWVKLGATVGGTLGRDRGGAAFTMGGVLTAVHLNEDAEWYGARVQLLADTNGNAPTATRWLVGGEAGLVFFGAIVSYAGEHYGNRTDHGVALHLKATIGYAAIYAGALAMVTSPDEYAFDFGLELKIPIVKP